MSLLRSPADRPALAAARASGADSGAFGSALWRVIGGRSLLRAPLALAVIFGLLAWPVAVTSSSYWLYVATETVVYLIAAAGLNLVLGYAGQISLAQGAFMGFGGYVVAVLTVDQGWTVTPSLVVAALLAFGLGYLIGIPALRVTTHYLAMITLGIEAIFLILANNASITNGALGIAGIPAPSVLGASLQSPTTGYLYIVVVATLILGAMLFVLNSPWGRAFKGIRENEVRAAMLGVNVQRYKVLAFAIACSVGAIAGGLLTSNIGYIDPDTFPLSLSFELLLVVVVGGSGRFEGPVFGAIIVTVLPELLRATASLYLLIFAGLTILLVMFMPRGLVTLWDALFTRVLRRPPPELTK